MNKKVCIVGAGTSRKYTPWKDESYDIWGLNHYFHFYLRWDLWFEFHKSLDLPEGKLINQKNFPYEEALTLLNIELQSGVSRYKYFPCTPCYMVAYAILQGYEEIMLTGLDFTGEREAVEKRYTELWLFLAMGKGIKIVLPDRAKLLTESFMYPV